MHESFGELRQDYAETGHSEPDPLYPHRPHVKAFPFDSKHPILVVGAVCDDAYTRLCSSEVQLKVALQEMEKDCAKGSVYLIGLWPGPHALTGFALNLDFYKRKAGLSKQRRVKKAARHVAKAIKKARRVRKVR